MGQRMIERLAQATRVGLVGTLRVTGFVARPVFRALRAAALREDGRDAVYLGSDLDYLLRAAELVEQVGERIEQGFPLGFEYRLETPGRWPRIRHLPNENE